MPRKPKESKRTDARVSTGIPGLDEIMNQGFVPQQVYLARGGPGSGKSTLGLHFLAAGASNGEKVLFITLGEPESQVRKNAQRIGFDLKGVSFLDLAPTPEFFTEAGGYDIFSPAEVERGPTTQKIKEEVERLKPTRVFVDSATQFRYLSTDASQFRKQMLALARYLTEEGATVVLSSEGSAETPDDDLQFLCDGVISLESGPDGRTIRVTKFRGSDFRSGAQSMRLGNRGMEVFPRLVPEAYTREYIAEPIASGVPELDELLHGGLERGTVTIISGPTGVGKTTLGLQFMKEAAGRGERSVVYTFEEGRQTMLKRCMGINIPVRDMIERKILSIVQVEPLHYTPDEFASLVRQEVEEGNARIVMIDSTSGYGLSLGSGDLLSHLRAMTQYLKNMGVTTILISEADTITGELRITEVGASGLADNIVFLRYLEIAGEMRRAIGVLKKRTSSFEKTLREFEITRYGLKVGEPLTRLRGILSGGITLGKISED
ncbi:ATPase domain-containing protein [Chloroflexota bacterium]